MDDGGACQGPGTVGVLDPVAGDRLPLPTPAVASKFSVVGAGSVSIGVWWGRGNPGGGCLCGGTSLAEELAAASGREAMVA